MGMQPRMWHAQQFFRQSNAPALDCHETSLFLGAHEINCGAAHLAYCGLQSTRFRCLMINKYFYSLMSLYPRRVGTLEKGGMISIIYCLQKGQIRPPCELQSRPGPR